MRKNVEINKDDNKTKQKMCFRILNPKYVNKILMETHHVKAIYSKDILNKMHKAGYKFELNGKRVNLKEIEDYCANMRDRK